MLRLMTEFTFFIFGCMDASENNNVALRLLILLNFIFSYGFFVDWPFEGWDQA